MHGRRWSDGLHQAVEAKEGVAVREENQTLATITIQNYFRMYHKLAGMTGTAETEEREFWEIYKLDVMVIPTNRPVRRIDKHDLIYKTRREKYNAIRDEVEQPDLTKPEIKKLGCYDDPPCGLVIIGTERHEARRIDRQLRGRSGRQGDPGQSVFFLALEDDLMRLFGSDRIARWMDRTGAEEGEVITHPWVTGAIGQAQKRVELQHFQARKKLLEYDDVMNQQREGFQAKLDNLKGMEKDVEAQLGAQAGSVRLGERALSRFMLGVIDEKWKDHLYDLDQLREGIYYRSWGQKDPLVEYKTEAFEMFKGLMSDVENTFAEGWFKDWWRNMPIEIAVPGGAPGAPAALRPPARTLTGPAGGQPGGGRRPAPVVATKPAADGLITSSEPAPMRVPRPATPEPAFARNPYAGVGRNDPCPCGSGKKFKKCHGAA